MTSTVRKLGSVAMVVTALTLGACVRSIARPTGVVTGIVDACQGLALPTGESLPVKVSFYSGSGLVASETVRSGAKYRLSVTPGSYRVTGWWGFQACDCPSTSHRFHRLLERLHMRRFGLQYANQSLQGFVRAWQR